MFIGNTNILPILYAVQMDLWMSGPSASLTAHPLASSQLDHLTTNQSEKFVPMSS